MCQHAEQLSPGEEDVSINFEEDDELTPELWSMYLQKAKEPKEPKEPREPREPKTSGSGRGAEKGSGSGSKGKKTQQDQLYSAVVQVSDDTKRLSEHLHTLTNNVSMRTKAGFPGLAQDLREIREVLEGHCGLIDEALKFIGYGDSEDLEDLEDVTDVEDVPDDGEPEF